MYVGVRSVLSHTCLDCKAKAAIRNTHKKVRLAGRRKSDGQRQYQQHLCLSRAATEDKKTRVPVSTTSTAAAAVPQKTNGSCTFSTAVDMPPSAHVLAVWA